MCGRMAAAFTHIEIEREYNIDMVMKEFGVNYNVAPSQQVPVIVAGSRVLNTFKWGFIPSWSKDGSHPQINARGETLLEKPYFKHAFIKRRCIILCSGFFEWNKSTKTPYYIGMKDNKPLALAGIFSLWENPINKKKETTCAVITTSPNKLVSKIHHRMPVILDKKDINKWIDPEMIDREKLMILLKAYDYKKMMSYQVSNYVNSPSHNDKNVLKPVRTLDDFQNTTTYSK
jgi:putative SOS response-associated peptidase YedK